jgi:signal transduction histidine kinase
MKPCYAAPSDVQPDSDNAKLRVHLEAAERELQQAKEELARSRLKIEQEVWGRTAKLEESVAAWEHFSYSLTHDLRAPLRSVRSLTESLAQICAGCSQAEAPELIRAISTSVDRMNRLITDALNYSQAVRKEQARTPVDVGGLLRQLIESCSEFRSDKAEIQIQGEIPKVLGNEAGLRQCFSNLLGNAVKFVAAGQIPKVVVRADASPDWVRIWVVDHGIGIPEILVPRIFEAFTRGLSTYEGSGLGLALVQTVIERMGGRVGVESEETKGSRFWIELKPAG